MKSVTSSWGWYLWSAITRGWLIPFELITLAFYVLPAWAMGWIKLLKNPIPNDETYFTWFMVQKGKGPQWWQKYWSKWGGWTGPGMVILNTMNERTITHERRHIDQYKALGPLFLLAYLTLWLCFGYKDNPFEIDAEHHERIL